MLERAVFVFADCVFPRARENGDLAQERKPF